MGIAIARTAVRERLTHDLRPLRGPAATGAYAAAKVLLASKAVDRRARGYRLLMRLYSSGFAFSLDGQLARLFKEAIASEQRGAATGLGQVINESVQSAVSDFKGGANPDPRRLVGSRILVVRSASVKALGSRTVVAPTLVAMSRRYGTGSTTIIAAPPMARSW